MGVVRCFCFRPWNDADQEADADTRQISQDQIMTPKQEADMALATSTEEERAPGMDAPPAGRRGESKRDRRDRMPRAIVLGFGGHSDQGKEATPLRSSEDGAGFEGRLSGEAIAIPEAEAVTRYMHTVEDLFKEGSLELTEFMWGNVRRVRRLKLNEANTILSWTYEVVFTKHVEKVQLKKATVMGTGKLVKIGVTGKKGLYHFEARDEAEAMTVRDVLSRHTGMNK